MASAVSGMVFAPCKSKPGGPAPLLSDIASGCEGNVLDGVQPLKCRNAEKAGPDNSGYFTGVPDH
ncbi:hypothetical protein GCM10027167_26300 [Nocardia heshunensis]